MAEERIHIEVSDEELDAAIAKANVALSKVESARTDVKDVDVVTSETLEKVEGLKVGAEDVEEAAKRVNFDELYRILPGINRETRILLSQVPGMRDALSLFYRLKMVAGGGELSLIVFAIFLLKWVFDLAEDNKREQEKQRREYEDMIREARGLKTRRAAREWIDEDVRQTEQRYRGYNP